MHDDAELARMLEAAVLERAGAIEKLVDGIAPQLLGRVRRVMGPAGLMGWLLPAQDASGIPGTETTISEHLMRYASATEGAHVELVADTSEIPEDARGRIVAESYLRQRPQEAARKSLVDALAKLIPRLDA